jgi:hypothetical protein
MLMYKKNVLSALNALRDTFIALGANPHRIDLPRPPGVMKVGVDDFLMSAGKNARKAFLELRQTPLFLSEGISGIALLQTKYEEPRWIVPGLLVEGLIILAGKPKVGKSWLVLSLALAIAAGKRALDYYDVKGGGKVAYLALEDQEPRLQARLKAINATQEDARNVYFFCSWNRVEEDGLLALERWLDENKDCRIVFIDTFARFRRMPKNNNSYYEDYEAASALKDIADKFRIGIVVVHHLRKEGAVDPFDAILGTNGIAGSADTNIVLLRDRGTADGTLHITGRSVEEKELAMSFDGFTWRVVGDAPQVHATKLQQDILLLLLDAGEPMTPTEIARELRCAVGGLSKTLRKMVSDGLIEKLKEKGMRGKYIPKPKREPNNKLRGCK